jgi:hypothetical protein
MSRRDDVKGYVQIDATGRMIAVGAALRQDLAALAGVYTHLPSDSTLLHFQRIGTVPPLEEFRQPVVLQGDIAGFGSTVDVINFVHSAQLSGNLIFVQGDIRKSLAFKDGHVRNATSNRAEDRLGEILYRYGALSREQLDRAGEECRRIRRPLGNHLLDRGYITQADLYLNVRRQVEEIFYSVLLFKDGDFFFTRSPKEAVTGPMALSAQSLLMEGLRRIDEMAYFRERIPDDGMRLAARIDVEGAELGARERLVLRLLQKPRTVEQVTRACRFGDFETMKILFHLKQGGFIDMVEDEAEVPAESLEEERVGSETATMIDTFNTVFERIYQAISRHGQHQALQKGLETFLQFYGFVELFQGVSFIEGRLDKDKLLLNLGRTQMDNRLSFLSQALNELLFFEMFAAREWLERDEQQELQKVINQLFIDIG